ncbi:MAG: MoaD/ThiS family protein [Anaerolineales bacterium]
MATLRIPTPLRAYTGGQSDVPVSGATAAEALAELVAQFPALKPHLFKEDGELRMFVNLFKGEENIKDLQGLQTSLGAGDRLMIIPSIAGG